MKPRRTVAGISKRFRQGRIFISRDDGASFALQGSATDAAWPKGPCCGSIYELPSADGKQLLMLASDFETVNGAQVCRTRCARSALPS